MSVAEPRMDAGLMADWFKQWQPNDTAKHLSRITGASVNTTRGWLHGHLPAPTYLARLFNFFGARFAAAVMPGVIWLQEINLDGEITATERRLDELRKEREAMRT